MSLDPVTNFGKVTVSTGYSISDTSVALSSGNGSLLPNPSADGAFNLVWYNATDYPDPSDDPDKEIVRCTARSSDTITITRAQESTSAVAHNTSAKTYKMILAVTKKMVTDIQSNLYITENPGGLIDGLNNIYSFTAKPRFVVVNGTHYRENKGWTWSTPNATISFTPQENSDVYGVM